MEVEEFAHELEEEAKRALDSAYERRKQKESEEWKVSQDKESRRIQRVAALRSLGRNHRWWHIHLGRIGTIDIMTFGGHNVYCARCGEYIGFRLKIEPFSWGPFGP